ncbi:MAG: tRNA (N(6)-L-threonylcarbamoyladenosine(37)-C(2))-methylthiotransferase [Candidatus Pacebacteria bacterium]|nr:tRNA (N(6)-L-threonylcarbamoyladenosine(37)-C(2))-methylthiotransferase [Candidatus Paceibacterota bacterium]
MKYFIKTFGCKLNHSDSALMDIFLSKKYEKTSNIDLADFVVLNTCGVVDTTANKILKEAGELRQQKKVVILGGCLPETMKNECKKVSDGILGPTNIDKICDIVDTALNGEMMETFDSKEFDKSVFIRNDIPINSTSAIVAISEGCLGCCSYCVTRLARRKLFSFNMENILLQINHFLKNGFREIQLTSQDLAIYGFDKGSQDLPFLLNRISFLEGDFKVKLGMMNPGWTKKIINDVLKEMNSEKYYKFLHIPVQSGSNELLLKMRRGYEREDFEEIANKFRNKFEDVIFSTDIIVGHPLETNDMFLETIKMLKKIQPEIIHIFKFSKRPNTLDENLCDLPDRIKKDRSRVITNLFHKMNEDTNRRFIGRIECVLVTEKRGDIFLSRTNSGRAVVLRENNLSIGKFVKVKIINSKWNYLEGKVIF